MKSYLLKINNLDQLKPKAENKGAILIEPPHYQKNEIKKWYPFELSHQPDTFPEYYKEKLGLRKPEAEVIRQRWNNENWKETKICKTFQEGVKRIGVLEDLNIALMDQGIKPKNCNLLSVPYYSWRKKL